MQWQIVCPTLTVSHHCSLLCMHAFDYVVCIHTNGFKWFQKTTCWSATNCCHECSNVIWLVPMQFCQWHSSCAFRDVGHPYVTTVAWVTSLLTASRTLSVGIQHWMLLVPVPWLLVVACCLCALFDSHSTINAFTNVQRVVFLLFSLRSWFHGKCLVMSSVFFGFVKWHDVTWHQDLMVYDRVWRPFEVVHSQFRTANLVSIVSSHFAQQNTARDGGTKRKE